jgi:hypothetical protein
MKKNIGPLAIVFAVAALLAFCYFMYTRSSPSVQGEYDPQKYGPPGYIKNQGGAGGGGPATPGGAGGAAPGGR